ncbi:MAG: 3'(2'),5'-bisphosphate nucleotidase CysQ [Pseudomonadota bacterium]
MSDLELMRALLPAAEHAGRAIMEIYAEPPRAEEKSDGTPVTAADRAAEEILIAALTKHAPDIPIISEEDAATHATAPADRFFLVDPLDGTREFLRRDGRGAFTVNIGLIERGCPVAGIVHAPALERTFYAAGGTACEVRNGIALPIRIRPCPAAGPLAVASRSHRDAETEAWLTEHAITETVATGSSLKFCLVAAGEADVYPRFGPTMEWDTAAGDAILRAAGGRVETPGEKKELIYGKSEYRNGAFIARGNY